jgi:stearoyl-CoA desaturase (Delta-9 desaturase)
VTRLERNVNIAAVVVPFGGVIAAALLLWDHFLGVGDVVVFAVMYVLSATGITVGFHRLLTHRAFQTHGWLRYALAIFGSMAVQGPVIDWVADHRKHHTFTDEDGDPHSPHVGVGSGLGGMLRGLWHAHTGWLFSTHGQASSKRFARDLVEDPGMRRINRGFPLIALASLLVPFLLGLALGAGWCASFWCTTSRGASTRSATSSAGAALTSTTTRPTCSGSRCRRSERRGTTITTPSRSRPFTGCAGMSLTRRGG